MNLDRFHSIIENPHHTSIPANPDSVAEVFRRNRVISSANLDMAITVNRALGFLE